MICLGHGLEPAQGSHINNRVSAHRGKQNRISPYFCLTEVTNPINFETIIINDHRVMLTSNI